MHPNDFQPKAAGRLERTPEGHWAFVPAVLPPKLTFPARLVREIADAERTLGELSAIGRMLPNPHLLLRPFVNREAILSSRIEGTVTRLDELLRHEAQADSLSQNPSDLVEVLNYVAALDLGLQRLNEGMPICLRLLRELHATLMDGVRGGDLRPGEFRNLSVLIGRPGQTFETARFVPPHPSALNPLLNDLERFLNEPGDLPVVAKLAIAHYQFEAIHPFQDGNGRVGRLLITLMLCAMGVLPQPLLYLSAYFEHHNGAYRDHLLAVSQRGAWTEWLSFFAVGVAEQARDAMLRGQKMVDLRQHYRDRVQAASQSVGILTLVDHLFLSPFITVPGVGRLLNVTPRAAGQNVQRLVDVGILRQTVPGQKTNRIFEAPGILELLEADMA